jgi:hypothetical protein
MSKEEYNNPSIRFEGIDLIINDNNYNNSSSNITTDLSDIQDSNNQLMTITLTNFTGSISLKRGLPAKQRNSSISTPSWLQHFVEDDVKAEEENDYKNSTNSSSISSKECISIFDSLTPNIKRNILKQPISPSSSSSSSIVVKSPVSSSIAISNKKCFLPPVNKNIFEYDVKNKIDNSIKISRIGHSITNVDNVMYIIGGEDQDSVTFSDLLTCNCNNYNNKSMKLSRQLCEFESRSFHSSIYINKADEVKSIVIFGGERNIIKTEYQNKNSSKSSNKIDSSINKYDTIYLDDVIVLDIYLKLFYPPFISGKNIYLSLYIFHGRANYHL